MENLKYKLSEIADWANNDSEVTIPALQRGLVWKPSQVELLWDSILRGFPIGSFMLSDITDEKNKGKYYLMDGQQRFNAISLGYNTVPNARAVLWIDLEPPTNNNSTRMYWVKATTIPHPWGFKNDDECSRLNTYEKREALKTFELQGNIYNREFSLKETWPVEANCPIPLWCLLEASKSPFYDAEAFLQKTIELFMATDFSYRHRIRFNENACRYLKEELYPSFVALKNYTINCNHLPKEVMESETENAKDSTEQTTLEVLFTRLNTGGTAISRDDLNYSAIKAYWPSIKDINDELAEKYMSPSKLVMLAFRLGLTDVNDASLKNELSIRQIRSLAKIESERNKIECLYKCEYLEFILKKIDEWLGVYPKSPDSTPSVLRTSIARNSPDVYLLLMFFAYENIISPIELTASQIKALAFCLHWFANDKKGCVQEIFTRCKSGINAANVQAALSRLMHDCKLLHIYSPEEVERFIEIEASEKWQLWQVLPPAAQEFFNRIFWYGNAEAKEMLLFAQRQYLNTHFSNYDPARQDLWAEYNRPWDFDHIVAQDRVIGKREKYREFDKIWLNSIGNIAAISYEANRSKSNGLQFDEYQSNEEALLYDRRVEALPFEITHYQSESGDFANITYKRFCNIYGVTYDMMKALLESTLLSNTLQQRKDLFMKIKEQLPDSVFCFAASDLKDHLLTREQDWAREWIGVGFEISDYFVCCEWDARKNEGKPIDVEIGIRKNPETMITKEKLDKVADLSIDGYEKITNNDWWYYWKDASDMMEVDQIVEEMRFLESKLRRHRLVPNPQFFS